MVADNMSVVHNCSKPESTLKKKPNSIAFHYVCSLCAHQFLPRLFLWCGSSQRSLIPADMFTKNQPGLYVCGWQRWSSSDDEGTQLERQFPKSGSLVMGMGERAPLLHLIREDSIWRQPCSQVI